jgi:hypothetical protein
MRIYAGAKLRRGAAPVLSRASANCSGDGAFLFATVDWLERLGPRGAALTRTSGSLAIVALIRAGRRVVVIYLRATSVSPPPRLRGPCMCGV